MRTSYKICVAVLLFNFGSASHAQVDVDLIRRVGENYRNLSSFEIAGHVFATIPGTEFHIRIKAADAEAGRSFVPAHSDLLKYREGQLVSTIEVTDKSGKPGWPSAVNGIAPPHHWGHYDQIAEDMKSAKELPPEVLRVEGVAVNCSVVEVVYDRESWNHKKVPSSIGSTPIDCSS